MMKLATVTKTYGATTLLAAGIFASAPAIAGDAKVFPGTTCVQQGTASTVTYNGEGRALNFTNSAVNVICPIVRDNTTEKWRSVTVVGADRNPDASLECTAVSAQKDGLFGGFNPQKIATSVPLAHFNFFEFDTLTFGPQSQERDDGTYFLKCTIPAKHPNFDASGIYSYRIDE